MEYGKYLQFLENNPEHKERKLQLIFSLFYPIAKELKDTPLYSLRLPIRIFRELEEQNKAPNFQEIQELCKEVYSSDKIIDEDYLISNIKEKFQISNFNTFTRPDLRTDEFGYFLKDETLEFKNFGTLTNYRYKNVKYFIERLSSYLETVLDLPKDYALKSFYNSKYDWNIPILNKSKTLDEDLAIALNTLCFRTFYGDDLFLSKLSKYRESIKLAS
tara:strand:- start:3239 stop:3889 length:651 start_codon:yes stop_codon:yes gene_type:complete